MLRERSTAISLFALKRPNTILIQLLRFARRIFRVITVSPLQLDPRVAGASDVVRSLARGRIRRCSGDTGCRADGGVWTDRPRGMAAQAEFPRVDGGGLSGSKRTRNLRAG